MAKVVGFFYEKQDHTLLKGLLGPVAMTGPRLGFSIFVVCQLSWVNLLFSFLS